MLIAWHIYCLRESVADMEEKLRLIMPEDGSREIHASAWWKHPQCYRIHYVYHADSLPSDLEELLTQFSGDPHVEAIRQENYLECTTKRSLEKVLSGELKAYAVCAVNFLF